MAGYKVPQDVEADDKLIGPFSFRQFIYLIIVVASIAVGWGLAQLFIPLAIIPLPLILLFGALALPLRKDQPMETYLAAIISFYLKPHRRLWEPDGQDHLIEIVAPKVVEVQRTKNLSQGEAERRLSYLANIVDTQGWAVRGVTGPVVAPNNAMNTDAYYEAQQAEDILDGSGHTASMIGDQLAQSDQRRHQELLARMHQPQPVVQQPQQPMQAVQPTPPAPQVIARDAAQYQIPVPPAVNPYDNLPTPTAPQVAPDDPSIHFNTNPYPTMNQSVIQPISATQPAPSLPQSTPDVTPPQNAPAEIAETPSVQSVSPDIMNLANNTDLSIETIAHEAQRIKQKESLPDDEVIISLR